MDFFKRLSDLASFLDSELHQIEASFHVIVNSGRKYDGPAEISLEIQGQIQELSGKIDELIKIGEDQNDHFDGFLKGMIDTVAEFDEKIQRIENYAANYGYVIQDKVKTDLRKSLHQIEVFISFIISDHLIVYLTFFLNLLRITMMKRSSKDTFKFV